MNFGFDRWVVGLPAYPCELTKAETAHRYLKFNRSFASNCLALHIVNAAYTPGNHAEKRHHDLAHGALFPHFFQCLANAIDSNGRQPWRPDISRCKQADTWRPASTSASRAH